MTGSSFWGPGTWDIHLPHSEKEVETLAPRKCSGGAVLGGHHLCLPGKDLKSDSRNLRGKEVGLRWGPRRKLVSIKWSL